MTLALVLFSLAVALGAAVFACRRNYPITPQPGWRREYRTEYQPYPLTPRELRFAIVSAQVLAQSHALLRAVATATPVDTGRARASWRAERALRLGGVIVDTAAAIANLSGPTNKAAAALRSLGVALRETGRTVRAFEQHAWCRCGPVYTDKVDITISHRPELADRLKWYHGVGRHNFLGVYHVGC